MGFVSVLFAYGAWGFVNAIGCVVAMEAVRSGAWMGVFVWFGAAFASALRWYGHTAEFVPGFNVVWKRESGNPAHWHSRPSTLEAHFTWCFPSEIVDQSLDDTRLTLEHYLNWE